MPAWLLVSTTGRGADDGEGVPIPLERPDRSRRVPRLRRLPCGESHPLAEPPGWQGQQPTVQALRGQGLTSWARSRKRRVLDRGANLEEHRFLGVLPADPPAVPDLLRPVPTTGSLVVGIPAVEAVDLTLTATPKHSRPTPHPAAPPRSPNMRPRSATPSHSNHRSHSAVQLLNASPTTRPRAWVGPAGLARSSKDWERRTCQRSTVGKRPTSTGDPNCVQETSLEEK